MITNSLHRAAGALALAALLAALGAIPAPAMPPPPPGGRHAVFYGGDNTAGYPQIALSGVGDEDLEALSPQLRVATLPNPFQRFTQLRFSLRKGDSARVRLFSTDGRLVREMRLRAEHTGPHLVSWDGRNESGALLSAGVYFYKVEAGSRAASGRLVFIR